MSDQPKHALQIKMEQLFSKNQTMPRIRGEFTSCEDFSFETYFKAKEIPVQFGYDLLTQMVLHKRADLPTLVGILQHHMGSAQATADMLLRCAEHELVDYNGTLSVFIIRFDISQDVKDDLERFQFPLPMVVEPKTITNNRQSGYLLNNSSVILKDNHHEDDVCLDHINRMNSIKFCVNMQTATMVKNQWANLDKPKSGETKEDFQKRVKAFQKYDRSVGEVFKILMSEGNEFYLTHRYDKRGRSYCQGYHVTYQGTAWNKAVIELVNKELVND